jgi:hypothetical protein
MFRMSAGVAALIAAGLAGLACTDGSGLNSGRGTAGAGGGARGGQAGGGVADGSGGNIGAGGVTGATVGAGGIGASGTGGGTTASGGSPGSGGMTGAGGTGGMGGTTTGGTATGGRLTGGTSTGGTGTGGLATGGTGGLGGTGGADGGTAGCATDCSATSCGTGWRPYCDLTVHQCLCSLDCSSNPGRCGTRESCQSVCSPGGECVCLGSCMTEGQIGFFRGCCPGLVEVYYYQDTASCTNPPGSGLYVCTSCGDQICGLGENHCNCPQDCP